MTLRTEETLLQAAAALLERDGPEGVTTRAVCSAANVTAPTLYHHFGDKNGLLDALVSRGIEAFLHQKQSVPNAGDALAGLVSGWESFIAFALDQPRLFKLMVQRVEDRPEILDAAMAGTVACLNDLSDRGRLAFDVTAAGRALLALSLGVTALPMLGMPRAEVEAVGRFLLDTTLAGLVRGAAER
jgi:AcrR family transcriptional regulator